MHGHDCTPGDNFGTSEMKAVVITRLSLNTKDKVKLVDYGYEQHSPAWADARIAPRCAVSAGAADGPAADG
jgi:hypothetical protein